MTLETEGEQRKKRGRPRKRQLKPKEDSTNKPNKKQKVVQTMTREPYAIRSRKIIDTSFIKLKEAMTVLKEYEFPTQEKEFKKTEKGYLRR